MSDDRPLSEQPPRAWRDPAPQVPVKRAARVSSPVLRVSPRRRKLFAILAAMLVLGGVIAAWPFLLHGFREPFFLSIPITEYSERLLAVNALAEQDSQALVAHFSDRHIVSNCQEQHQLEEELNSFDDMIRATKRPAVVVHLRAHAVSRNERVWLLPGNAQLDKPDTWVALEEVVRGLRRCPASHRLLILDVMQPIADPRLGILTNDIADQVQAFLETELGKEDLPALWVLCACGRGQVSLVSEEMDLSVFGHFLDEGLRGNADGYNKERKQDGRVSVKELATFVAVHVDRWAKRNRGTEQTPVLLGQGEDFELVALTSRRAPTRPAAANRQTLPPWLLKGWDLRDKWWQEKDLRTAPRAGHRLEAALLRAEQRWRGGIKESLIQDDLGAEISRLQDQVEHSRLTSAPRPGSLAQARAQDKEPDLAVEQDLAALLAEVGRVDIGAKPEDLDKQKQELGKLKKGLLDRCKDKPFELGWAAMERAADEPRPEKVRFLSELLSQNQPASSFAEVRFLHRLADFLQRLEKKKGDAERLPPDAVPVALRALQKAEKAAACDPRVLPWIKDRFEDATTKRRRATQLLFTGRLDSWPQAVTELQDAERDYQRLVDANEKLRQAYDIQDRALALLPLVMPYLLARQIDEGRMATVWDQAVHAILDLDEHLAKRSLEELPVIENLGPELERYLRELQQPFTTARIKALSARMEQERRPAMYLELEALLESPWMTSKNREAVWSAARQMAEYLNEETQATGRDYDPEKQSGTRGEGLRSVLPERGRAALRAHLSIDLLKLAGLTGISKLEQQLKNVRVAGAANPWSDLGAQLRAAWTEQLPRQLRSAQDNLAAADRMSRLLYFLDDGIGAMRRNPTAQLRRQEAETYWQWVEAYHQAEFP